MGGGSGDVMGEMIAAFPDLRFEHDLSKAYWIIVFQSEFDVRGASEEAKYLSKCAGLVEETFEAASGKWEEIGPGSPSASSSTIQ